MGFSSLEKLILSSLAYHSKPLTLSMSTDLFDHFKLTCQFLPLDTIHLPLQTLSWLRSHQLKNRFLTT